MIILFNTIILTIQQRKPSYKTDNNNTIQHDNTIQQKQSLAIKTILCVWDIQNRNRSEEHQSPLVHFNMIILLFNMIILFNKGSLAAKVIILFNMMNTVQQKQS